MCVLFWPILAHGGLVLDLNIQLRLQCLDEGVLALITEEALEVVHVQ